ncbi:hypothetical protein [Paraburkholderia humisilvae]|uniref:Alginate biosynthesis protein AlgF n=1 Tax=Paraburkholderia humisilvae TaxID=627669 RepID=A0A6J5DL18_9BURK|nr:hypothetical protein [Paraburkholderia humisilvae]CAB3753931.1 hypothetical protein LMG29542_02193 [Paraburkholderia humisilvae]
MKKLASLIFATCAAIATAAHAEGAGQSAIHLADSPSVAFIGDSIDWNVHFGKDGRDIVLSPRASVANETNMIFLTPGGPAAYDIAKNGAATPDNDRRIVQNGGTLELAPRRVSILELPGEITRVEASRSLRLHIMGEADHRYVALKYLPFHDSRIKETGRLTVTTDSGTYSFDVAVGAGAPVYRLATPI